MYNFCNLLENDFCNDIVECILTFSVEASNNKKSTVLLFPPPVFHHCLLDWNPTGGLLYIKETPVVEMI